MQVGDNDVRRHRRQPWPTNPSPSWLNMPGNLAAPSARKDRLRNQDRY